MEIRSVTFRVGVLGGMLSARVGQSGVLSIEPFNVGQTDGVLIRMRSLPDPRFVPSGSISEMVLGEIKPPEKAKAK